MGSKLSMFLFLCLSLKSIKIYQILPYLQQGNSQMTRLAILIVLRRYLGGHLGPQEQISAVKALRLCRDLQGGRCLPSNGFHPEQTAKWSSARWFPKIHTSSEDKLNDNHSLEVLWVQFQTPVIKLVVIFLLVDSLAFKL